MISTISPQIKNSKRTILPDRAFFLCLFRNFAGKNFFEKSISPPPFPKTFIRKAVPASAGTALTCLNTEAQFFLCIAKKRIAP